MCVYVKIVPVSDTKNKKMVVVTDLGPPEEGIKATQVNNNARLTM